MQMILQSSSKYPEPDWGNRCGEKHTEEAKFWAPFFVSDAPGSPKREPIVEKGPGDLGSKQRYPNCEGD